MFVVLLKFSKNKANAGQFMEGHKQWLKRGFDDGVFLLAGSLQPNQGGGIVAHDTSLPDLQSRVNADPFVAENVVEAEILEITPSRADARLNFLLDQKSGGLARAHYRSPMLQEWWARGAHTTGCSIRRGVGSQEPAIGRRCCKNGGLGEPTQRATKIKDVRARMEQSGK